MEHPAYDVAVVGTGPAGSTAARSLAQKGLSVALLEKEILPRPKVCGGGIVFRARAMLGFDITPVVRCVCHTASMSLLKGGLSFSATRDKPVVSMVMRAEFDALLAEKAREAGARLLQDCCVESASFHEDGVVLQTSHGEIRSGFVIAADGANSTMARLAGWPRFEKLAPLVECELKVPASDYTRFVDCARFDFDLPPNGYAWIFPKGDHLGVGICCSGTSAGKVNLKRCLGEYLQLHDLPLPDAGQLSGYVIPLLPRQGGFVRNRVFLTGDAAGVADPVSAEGISNAITTGMLAASAIVDGGMNAERSAELYEAAMTTQLLPELAAARKLAGVLYASRTLRKLVLKQYGQRMTEKVADIFMGEACFKGYEERFMQKLGFKR